MPDISIVMPCYNRAHDLIDVLRAYDQQHGDESFEIIAVDDASTDATYQVLASFQPARYTLRAERLTQNSGPAAARNHGIRLADSPLILIVGDDIRPDKNLVHGHLLAHRYYPNPGDAILGHVTWPSNLPVNTLMSHIDGIGAQQFSYHYLRDGQEYDFRHFYTANVSIKTDFLRSLERWFDTDFRHAALEDAELAYRLAKRGLHVTYISALVGYHYHYHNIWTFSNRQRKTGLMVNVLTSKHPNLRRTLFRSPYMRVLRLLRRPGSLREPLTPAEIESLEYQACLLASSYEWRTNKSLDRLYLGLLDYFYHDGALQGIFNGSRILGRVRSAHARRYLKTTMRSFIEEGNQKIFEHYLTIKSCTWDISTPGLETNYYSCN
jgi:GT2 family glycosyltransferase